MAGISWCRVREEGVHMGQRQSSMGRSFTARYVVTRAVVDVADESSATDLFQSRTHVHAAARDLQNASYAANLLNVVHQI